MVLLSDLRERNLELTEARAELAQSAVAQERERFARDLHDLLGHTLSVIAIKAELAGRLLPERPDEAAAEVADVEQVARKALGEVREAVSGYRKPTLDGELEGARMALTAAGIEAAFERSPVRLDPEVEAVLAWAVREGATNVIRHSSAHRCQVTVSADAAGAVVEVVDDGQGQRVPEMMVATTVLRSERARVPVTGSPVWPSARNGCAGASRPAAGPMGWASGWRCRYRAARSTGAARAAGVTRAAVAPRAAAPLVRPPRPGPHRDPRAHRRGPGDGPWGAGQPARPRARLPGRRPGAAR